jgi:hypothetical protein
MSLQNILTAQTFNAVGAGVATITGVTTANPATVTTSTPHGLATGNSVQITGILGATQANVTTTVTVTDSTHFSIPVNVTGSYSSGGQVSLAYDISQITPFAVRLRVDSTLGTQTFPFQLLALLQDSADGFVNDIKTVATVSLAGNIGPSPQTFVWLPDQIPSFRAGISLARMRLFLAELTTSGSVTVSLFLEL